MGIIRIMVVDPEPRKPLEDVIVYQVPERSRAHELLTQLLDEAGIEYVDLKAKRKKKNGEGPPDYKPLFNEESSND